MQIIVRQESREPCDMVEVEFKIATNTLYAEFFESEGVECDD